MVKLTPDKLKVMCPPDIFKCESTKEIPPLKGIIGQERAVKAVDFGLNIIGKGYNIYVAGPTGTGKTSYAKSVVSEKAKDGKIPEDYCYVYNFDQPEKPCVLSLPPGKGSILVKDMEDLIQDIKNDIPKAFEGEEYEKERTKVMQKYQDESNKLIESLEKKAQEEGFMLKRTGKGIITIPLINGKQLEEGDFENLPEETRKEITEKSRQLQISMDEITRKIKIMEQDTRKEIEEVEKKIALSTVKPSIENKKEEYHEFLKISEYLDKVQEDVIKNLVAFKQTDEKESQLPFQLPTKGKDESFFIRYKVNLFVNNGDTEGSPVIIETNPTYYNLFGKIEGKSQFGAINMDFTMIRNGAIHRANGGYLIVQALDILKDPLSWATLKRTLENQEAIVENIGEQYKVIPTVTLKPEPIKVNLKVILIGSPEIYQLLYNLDADFKKLFKVKAQFDSSMEKTEENINKYCAFISSLCTREELNHFDKSAVRKTIEYSCRLSSDVEKLSTRFNEMVEIIYEASEWAKQDSSQLVTEAHVKKAIEEKKYRANLPEEKIHEMLTTDKILVSTEGTQIGQINGLSVYQTGEYAFGRPSRITAKAFVGEKGLINIEREADMSGNIHNKGVLILSGYMGGKYATDKPLSLSASLCFEQNYGGIDGDSASCAELIALASSLSKIPVKQSMAITGSMNQMGDVQPIGGVNEKIEGFFKVCQSKGLTGEQGVVIPIQNESNLMLEDEVVEAVKEGKFHIYSVKTIDEAIKLMTGEKAETVHQKINEKLEEFAKSAEEYSS